ncbi:MAG: hypothetical protein H6635_14170 [Anaerolineales bacterium]|nr:hypothetical protein [Anaerolineales bacterium]MCB9146508.1 hypothetical protein [Anaerolineales bacterium]
MNSVCKFFILVILSALVISCSAAEVPPTETVIATQTVPPTATVNAVVAAVTAGALTKAAPRTPTATPAYDSYQVSVPAAACWMDSGVAVTKGQRVTIFASGIGNTNGGVEGSNSDPNGQTYICGAIECPVQGVGYGSLIARVGDQNAFFVGTYLEFIVEADGSLMFTVNDWECDDNSGSFELKVVVD